MSEVPTASYLDTIRRALANAPDRCRFHGEDFGFLGYQWGEPRCESCQQPWRIVEARAALARLEGGERRRLSVVCTVCGGPWESQHPEICPGPRVVVRSAS